MMRHGRWAVDVVRLAAACSRWRHYWGPLDAAHDHNLDPTSGAWPGHMPIADDSLTPYSHVLGRLLPDARQLAAKGAEVVQADAADAAQLRAAFQGAYGVFLMTTGPDVKQAKPELELGALESSRGQIFSLTNEVPL